MNRINSCRVVGDEADPSTPENFKFAGQKGLGTCLNRKRTLYQGSLTSAYDDQTEEDAD